MKLKRGARRRAWAFCAIWWASRSAANRATAARSVVLPLIRCTGTVRPAGRGQRLSPFADWTGSKFKKKPHFSYNILGGICVISSSYGAHVVRQEGKCSLLFSAYRR
ncbi:exported hypothetical protein [Klebsiella grimontii]|uniref:Secreted protein n=1 Tax=Klebsiella grimontii TaxID=2058152 RepID=A0A285B303_9ENTR|nr:exported hypothetical protein [Klebsiella grimontii]